jgi:transketolase
VDYNHMQSYGTTAEVLPLEPLAGKWRAFGFAAEEVDGHDPAQLEAALARIPFQPGRPSVIICHTVKGRGVSFMENAPAWHHKNRATDEEIAAIRAELGEVS